MPIKRFGVVGAAFAFLALSATTFVMAQTQSSAKTKSMRGSGTQNASAMRGLDRAMAIDGNPSTLAACVGGRYYNTHALGFATQGTRIIVNVQSGENIDPTASMSILRMGSHHPDGGAEAQLAFDDDSGGNLDPRLELSAPFDGHVVLNVGSFDGSFGCYFVKVEVRAP